MTDIVERLRGVPPDRHALGVREAEDQNWNERNEAADEIERLRAQLKTIADHTDTPELIWRYAVGLLDARGMPTPDFKMAPAKP